MNDRDSFLGGGGVGGGGGGSFPGVIWPETVCCGWGWGFNGVKGHEAYRVTGVRTDVPRRRRWVGLSVGTRPPALCLTVLLSLPVSTE